MKLVIDIPELQYEAIMKSKVLKDVKADYIRNAIVLPKGHGRLKDIDNIFSYSEDLYEAIDLAPTIIEADKGE